MKHAMPLLHSFRALLKNHTEVIEQNLTFVIGNVLYVMPPM